MSCPAVCSSALGSRAHLPSIPMCCCWMSRSGRSMPFTREQLQREIAVILAQSPKTVVFITHNMDEAVFFSDRILVMGTRPGRILEEVRVDLPRPREADAVRASREFATMREHLWSLLSQGDKAA